LGSPLLAIAEAIALLLIKQAALNFTSTLSIIERLAMINKRSIMSNLIYSDLAQSCSNLA